MLQSKVLEEQCESGKLDKKPGTMEAELCGVVARSHPMGECAPAYGERS